MTSYDFLRLPQDGRQPRLKFLNFPNAASVLLKTNYLLICSTTFVDPWTQENMMSQLHENVNARREARCISKKKDLCVSNFENKIVYIQR